MENLKIYYLFAVLAFGFIPFHLSAKSNGDDSYAKTSVLSTGNWYQMKVDSNGIYKLTYDEIKKYISDPSKVKIYGYGGWILDEDFRNPYIDDLPEVSVYIDKGADGIFNSGDFLLFYGRGTVKWSYKSGRFEHENNPYATYGSYFLTEGETGSKEMNTVPSFPNPAATSVDVFDDYALHERDLSAFAFTGRELFGESFANQSNRQQLSFSVPGIISDLNVRFSFAAASKDIAAATLSIEDKAVATILIPALPVSNTYLKAYLKEATGNYLPENGIYPNPVKMTVTYDGSGQAYLNFIELFMKRSLQFYNTPFTFFRNTESISKDIRYTINNAGASCLVWDVTGNYDVQLMQTSLEGNQMSFAVQAENTNLREYAMVDPGKTFPSPQIVGGKIPNQDLHALPQTDMVIISPAVYLQQAGILAEKHRTKSGLNVEVVEETRIFNEFSSGTPDATAYRRFMKMFYDRAAGEQDKPKYLLLFGDGVFDNRHFTSGMSKLDPKYYLLTYQEKESVNETDSHGSDDYFGLLEDNSGPALSGKLCLGIGRFPVSSVSQAEDVVNKVISYMDNTQGGNWKSKLVFTADNTDDFSTGLFCIHADQANQLAGYMDETYPEYILYKYFMDAYQPVSVNGKTTYPDAKRSFLNTLNEGCFLVNYTGHGSITAWSAEDMLNILDVRQMNFKNLPVWITATCDFGWFDRGSASGGEEALLNKKSGAIALYTTSRVVDSRPNFELNDRMIRYLFTLDETGKHLRLGDVLRKSKNDLSGTNKLNYVLLGDPALVLNYPEMKVKVDTVNGKAVTNDMTFAFKALEKVTVSGSITDESGAKMDGFSGELRVSVFDSKQETKSYRQNEVGDYFSFNSYPNMVHQAESHVENGSFQFSFTVPLDISYAADEPSSYATKNGKMNFYASDAFKQDAFGYFDKYIFSGTSDVISDETGPEIKEMYLNTAGFKDGDDVNETPYFHARVFDETGINISGSGLGHDILIGIDGNPAWTYYRSKGNAEFKLTPDGDDWIISFSIPELPAGEHTLSFTVWDIMNNLTVDTLHFNVIKGYKPAIFDLQASENPAKTGTTFVLSHNLPETLLTVDIRVYDLSGRIVWSHSQKTVSASAFPACAVDWDLHNNAGSRVQPGVYIYWATVRTESSKEVTKAKKIVVLEQ
ncbi:MAG: type IX secretion system sortase PorU [Dysgonamonadaceae bacterium]|jgi:hypothetical protein|nr:type IX secretion system sortase PorU [Dysgonamonadaceae bacterium]